MSTQNHKHVTIKCETCNTTHNTVYDNRRAETYCLKCGTVIQDTRLPLISDEIRKTEHKVKFIRDLWKTKRKIK